MSSKAIIEAIKLAMSQSIRSAERDVLELNQLQNSPSGSNWPFAMASYRGSFKKLASALSSITLAQVIVPQFIFNPQGNGAFLHYRDAFFSQGGTKPKAGKHDEKKFDIAADGHVTSYLEAGFGSAFVVNPISTLECMARGMPFVSISVGIGTLIDRTGTGGLQGLHDAGHSLPENGLVANPTGQAPVAGKVGVGVEIDNAIVYDLYKSGFYTSTKNNGAYLNLGYDIKLTTSYVNKISNANVFSYISQQVYPNEAASLGKDELAEKRSNRRALTTKIIQLSLSAASYNSFPNPEMGIIYVASGKCDIFAYCGSVDFARFASAIAIAIEAGAVLLNSKGAPVAFEEIVASGSADEGFFVTNKNISQNVRQFLLK